MSCFTVSRALAVRLIFAVHGIVSIWRLHVVTNDARVWYIAFSLLGLALETVITIKKNRGHEWKWFCPSVLFYLLSVVPAIWFLELQQLERRLQLKKLNITLSPSYVHAHNGTGLQKEQDLRARIDGIGMEIVIPLSFSSDQWLRALEQLLLLFLILGRWLLPKGKLTHDQLSQLLLVYIATAADIVEFFEAFKEEEVRYNPVLCHAILGIWSWSLMQFMLVFTAAKARQDRSGILSRFYRKDRSMACCAPDVYGIVISIFLQDAPYLVLRLLLIFKYGVLSYTNMFFTCKNSLVITLLLYRLIVVQMEKRHFPYPSMSENGSSPKHFLPVKSNSSAGKCPTRWPNSKGEVTLIETEIDPNEPPVQYIIKRHFDSVSAPHIQDVT